MSDDELRKQYVRFFFVILCMSVCSMTAQYARGSDLWISFVWTVAIISGFIGCVAFWSVIFQTDED